MAGLRLHEGWSESQIRSHQDRALRKLVAHAAAHVPYYRDLFRSLGLRASDIRTREDLALLPVLTRAELRQRGEDLISDIAPRNALISCLHVLAHHALEHGTSFHPRLVLMHGETLMPETRALVGRALGCEVRNTYGAMEAFRIACECQHGRLLVLLDSTIV